MIVSNSGKIGKNLISIWTKYGSNQKMLLRLPNYTPAAAASLTLVRHLSHKIVPKTLVSLPSPTPTMSSSSTSSSWSCPKCTFKNSSSQNSRCEICFTQQPQTSSPTSKPKWSCTRCTFLNDYRTPACEICGTRASATLRSALELDDSDFRKSSVGSVFLPLRGCTDALKHVDDDNDASKGSVSVRASTTTGNSSNFTGRSHFLGNGLKACSNNNKRKIDEDAAAVAARDDHPIEVEPFGDSNLLGSGFSGLKACSNKRKRDEDAAVAVAVREDPFEVEPLGGDVPMSSGSKTWKVLSYNVWFRDDLEMHKRMNAIGNLIRLHSPDVICFQEVIPESYAIFQQSSWWKGYRCSITDVKSCPGGYFCMQLSKLPVKSYSTRPFYNSIMGRKLCVAEVEVQPGTALVVATSHLESPCPGPPTWDQMFSKERVDQAKEAVTFLDKNPNVIFCGDMNWDDKLDGPFPSSNEWLDAWTQLKPGEDGWTYDTKANPMLTGNRKLQKRLDRFLCKLKDFKISGIQMIGMDAIPGVSYIKEKKFKGQTKEFTLPVLPSDHFGLLLTISAKDST